MENLDPQAVQLSQSIRQVESGGNFEASGASGEHGAYQFTPDTWNSEAPKYGVNSQLTSSTPEEQNKVAYSKIKDWKNQGYNPGQIASMWNAGQGEPNAYTGSFSNGSPSVGKNQFGVDYNVPDYANKVAQTYQTIKNGGEITSDISGAPKVQDTPSHPNFSHALDYILPTLLIGGTLAAIPFTGGASAAALPEEAAGVAGAEGLAGATEAGASAGGAGGIIGKVGSFIKNIFSSQNLKNVAGGIAGSIAGNAVRGIFGQNAPQMPTGESNNLDNEIPQAMGNSNSVSHALFDALSSSTLGNKYLASPNAGEGLSTAALYGATPSQGANGTMNSLPAITSLNSVNKNLSQGIDSMLSSEGGMANKSEVLQHAYDNIESSPNLSPTEKEERKGHALKEVESYHWDKNGQMPLIGMEKAKRQQYASGKEAFKNPAIHRSKAHAHSSLGLAFRKTITNNTKHKELYESALKHEQHIFKGIEGLKILHGKKMTHEKESLMHQIAKEYGKYAGASLGNKIGGPLGAVLGYNVSKHLTNAVDKRFGKTVFERKGVEAYMNELKKHNPAVYDKFQNDFKKYGVKVPLQLPAKGKSSFQEQAMKVAPKGSAMESTGAPIAGHYTSPKAPTGTPKKGLLPPVVKNKPAPEPYISPEKLPVIKAGRGKKRPNIKGLKTIKF